MTLSLQIYAAFSEGRYVCYGAPDGRTRRYFGCWHESPKAAIAHKANLDPYVSPLRRGVHADPGFPLPESGQSDLSPEPRGSGLLDRPAI